MTGSRTPDLDGRIEQIKSGDRSALAHAISDLERTGQPHAQDLIAALAPHLTGTPVIGITGPPGAGKSTLLNALIARWRTQERRIAVIAVDPSSPVSGGAILGDRLRMSAALDDDGVFVRSLASQGHLGGLSPSAVQIIDALDVAGYDLILLETVGTGQNEVDIASVADVRVVIAAPGLGDDIQAIKAGLLEIADVLVVNKADHPDAAQTAQQLRGAISLRDRATVPPEIMRTIATRGEGVAELADNILNQITERLANTSPDERRLRRARYMVLQAAIQAVRSALDDDTKTEVVRKVSDGALSPVDAARQILET